MTVIPLRYGRCTIITDIAGAGTGIVDGQLRRLGHDLAAMGLSTGMLNWARRNGIYGEFHRMVRVSAWFSRPASLYATIGLWALPLGRAPAGSLDETVRVARQGGHVIFRVRPNVCGNNGFPERREALASSGDWRPVLATNELRSQPGGDPDLLHRIVGGVGPRQETAGPFVRQVSPAHCAPWRPRR